MSHAQVAEKIGYTRQYISLAERPRKGPPSMDLVQALDRALAADGVLIALRERLENVRRGRRRGGDRVTTSPPMQNTSSDVAADELPDAVPSAPVDLAPGDVAAELARLQQIDQASGPGHALSGVLGLLDGVTRRMDDTHGADRGILLRVAAQAAEFAGFLQRDLGNDGKCLYWHDRAMEYAQQTGDEQMQAYVLLRKAQAAYDHRNAARMLDLTLAAVRVGHASGPGLRAELFQQQARGEAMLGARVDRVQILLDDAVTTLSVRNNRSPDEPGQHYNERLLSLQSALCLTEAGRPADAIGRYQQILSTDMARRDHAYFSILMATSLALSGEPDEAATIGCAALPVATASASRRTVRETRILVDTLMPWRQRDQVRQLRSALSDAETSIRLSPSAPRSS